MSTIKPVVGAGGGSGGGGVPSDGSVTNVKVASNAAISADKLVDGSANRIMTAAERTKLAAVATNANAGYATVLDEGTARTARLAMNFAGAGVTVTDDSANSRTLVTIPGGSGSVTNILSARDFGAAGNGTTDDTASLQAWLNAIPEGGKGYLPTGTYRITSGLTLPVNAGPAQLEGASNLGQSDLLGVGGSVILVDGSFVGLTIGHYVDARFQGSMVRNIVFQAGTTGVPVGGLLIRRQNNYVLENVAAFDFNGTGSYGVYIDGSDGTTGSQSGKTSQYGQFINPSLNNCSIGLKLYRANGIRVFGGMLDGNNNNGTVPTNRTAIQINEGDTCYFFGVVIQFYTIAIDVPDHENAEFHAIRIEGCTTGYRLGAASYGSHIFGGEVNNSIIGGGGTGVSILSGSQRNGIYGVFMTTLATNIADAGSSNVVFVENIMDMGAGSGGYLKPPRCTTGARPAAATAGAGAMVYDTSLSIPIWSNGTVWRNAAGTTV